MFYVCTCFSRTKLGRRARDRQESQSAMAAAGQSQAVTTTSYSSPRSRYTDTEKMLAQSLEAENLPLTGEVSKDLLILTL